MSDVVAALRELSEPWQQGDKIKAAIGRAAKRCGLSYWRVFDIWYGKARRVDQFELDAVASALEQKRKADARNELHELRTRLTRLESLMAQADSDFFRPSLAAVSEQIRQVGGKSGNSDSTLD